MEEIMKREVMVIATFVLAVAGPATVAAQPLPPLPPPQTQVSGPVEVLQEGIGKVSAFLNQGGTADPVQLGAFLESEVAPYFDFEYMARWAAGPRYAQMGENERQALGGTLRRMFLSSMAEHIAGYRQARVNYLPPRSDVRSGEVMLSVQAMQPGLPARQLDFRLYHSGEGWKVFDVVAEGQSALVYYRQYFARALGRPGPRLPY
jgi:phospholipid transport system substrate-binding protein